MKPVSEVRSLLDAYSWSVARLADCFGVHRQTMAKRIREAGLVPTGELRGNPTYSIRDVAEMLYMPVAEETDAPRWDSVPEQRKAWYQSENERVKLEKELRLLIPVDEVHREMSRLAKAVSSSLDGLPDLLERDAALSGDAIERVERVTDALREQMHVAIMTDPGSEADG